MVADKNDLDKIIKMYEISLESQMRFGSDKGIWSYEEGFQCALKLVVAHFLAPYEIVYDNGWKIK